MCMLFNRYCLKNENMAVNNGDISGEDVNEQNFFGLNNKPKVVYERSKNSGRAKIKYYWIVEVEDSMDTKEISGTINDDCTSTVSNEDIEQWFDEVKNVATVNHKYVLQVPEPITTMQSVIPATSITKIKQNPDNTYSAYLVDNSDLYVEDIDSLERQIVLTE